MEAPNVEANYVRLLHTGVRVFKRTSCSLSK